MGDVGCCRAAPQTALCLPLPRNNAQDTGARLNFVLAALRPYLLELQAKASLKRQLG